MIGVAAACSQRALMCTPPKKHGIRATTRTHDEANLCGYTLPSSPTRGTAVAVDGPEARRLLVACAAWWTQKSQPSRSGRACVFSDELVTQQRFPASVTPRQRRR